MDASGGAAGAIPFEFAYFQLPRLSTPTANDLMAAELFAALQVYTDPSHLYHLASGLLGIGESAVAPDLYRAFRASGDPELRFVGLAGLLRANDMSALAEIANNTDLVPNLKTGGLVFGSISGRRDADPTAIGYLGRIASSPDADMQRSAALALQYIHTRDTLPFLAKLLDSKDPITREAAMRGLSRFVDNLPIATRENTHNGKDLIPQGPAVPHHANGQVFS